MADTKLMELDARFARTRSPYTKRLAFPSDRREETTQTSSSELERELSERRIAISNLPQ